MFGLVPFGNKNSPTHDYFNQLMRGIYDDDYMFSLTNMVNSSAVSI